MSSIEETKGIQAVMIIEVIGRPPKHLTETLEKIINEIDKEKGVRVMSKKINEPELMKDQKDFYMNFAEVEVEVEDVLHIVILMFKYMPAHIEIVYPEAIVLNNNGWNDILNEVSRRLHGYDEIARVVSNEKMILEKKLLELMGEKKKGQESPAKKKVRKKGKKLI
ncbi:MAG TPA: hypothetical protein VJZ93_02180 [Candidatus Nanoarchaeia archaeon]|nr:hypothetical protein [Candidatus Nanoarchaeia archaeon]